MLQSKTAFVLRGPWLSGFRNATIRPSPEKSLGSQDHLRSWAILKSLEILEAECKQKIFPFIPFAFLGPHLCHMEVPGLGVEWELQLQAYTTVTAMWGPTRICNLYHSSWQCWILNPLSRARDRTQVLMDTSRVHFRSTTIGNPKDFFLKPTKTLRARNCHKE